MQGKIRVCSREQVDLLREIAIETYADTFSDSNSTTLMAQYFQDALNREKLLSELDNPYSCFYFIYFEKQVAGFLKVNVMTAQTDINDLNALEIERFYIRKAFLSRGLGKQLMDFAKQRAEQLSKEYLWLGVWENNHRALHFYKNMGFYQIGSHPFDMGGDIQTDLLFRKDL
ncbi:GNAT family N-acetyltransferase [Psychromonas sp.]|uniref:GNAT family N-acetyltransferase n=1 Tax=Psychromonas sp. TaxID=1884585 RepID=UPI003564B4C8